MPSRNIPRTLTERLERLLESARNSDYYSKFLSPSGDIDLNDLPLITAAEFYSSRNDFVNRRGQNETPELRYPLQPEPVVKVLIPGFKPVPWILGPSSEGRYDTIAAPVDKLRQVARNGRELRYPCIAFVGPNHGLMTGEDRELFWKSFRVPTFEVFLGIHGEVVAEECEAHEGLHVRETTVVESCSGQLAVTSFDCLRTPVARLLIGMSGRMEHRPCACGSSAPRIMDLTMAPVTRAVVAATA